MHVHTPDEGPVDLNVIKYTSNKQGRVCEFLPLLFRRQQVK